LFETGAIVFQIAERHAGPVARRCECPGARDHMDVRRAQHGGGADPWTSSPAFATVLIAVTSLAVVGLRPMWNPVSSMCFTGAPASARLLEGDKSWSAQRMPLVENRVRDRLDQLFGRLGDADWLDGPFSAGDLMMVSVLLRLKSSGMLNEYPNLAAYVARREARPAAFRLGIRTSRKPNWTPSILKEDQR
jgi:glutathione S-transferase